MMLVEQNYRSQHVLYCFLYIYSFFSTKKHKGLKQVLYRRREPLTSENVVGFRQ